MKHCFLPVLCLFIVVAAPAHATKLVAGNACGKMKENVTLTVTLNEMIDGLDGLESKVKVHAQKIEQLAAQQKDVALTFQSANYTVNVQPQNGAGAGGGFIYRLGGSLTYGLGNMDVAIDFADALTKQNYQISLSANGYRDGNCNTVAGFAE